MTGWLNYFLRAVAQQAEDAIAETERLVDIRGNHRRLVQAATRGRAIEVVDLVLENPIQTARSAARRLGVSGQSVLDILRQIGSTGILRPAAPGADGRYRWVCDEILWTVYDGG